MMTGANPSVGSSSRRSRAPVRRMRPMASICCSPPESFVPWLESRSRRLGNSSKMRSSAKPARDAPAAAAADFPSRRGWREDAAFFRTEGDAGAGDRIGGRLISSLPSKRTEPVRLLDHAHDGFQRRRLADAVAAKQRDHLAGLHVEGDAMQDVRFAVPGLAARSTARSAPFSGIVINHGRSRDRLRARPGPPTRSCSRLRPAPGRGSEP